MTSFSGLSFLRSIIEHTSLVTPNSHRKNQVIGKFRRCLRNAQSAGLEPHAYGGELPDPLTQLPGTSLCAAGRTVYVLDASTNGGDGKRSPSSRL